MRVEIVKFLRALLFYFLYYVRLFPLEFSLQVVGVCSGLLTVAALLGLLVPSEIQFFILVLTTFLAFPLVINSLIFALVYWKFRASRDEGSQYNTPKYTLDSSYITDRMNDFSLDKNPESGRFQYLIFETLQIGAPRKHLAVWSSDVNRELFFYDAVESRYKFRVNKSLKLSRLRGICRDWRARRVLLMFHIFDSVSKGKMLSDDTKIGFSGTFVSGPGEVCLDVFPISFFDSLLTNGIAGRVLVCPLIEGSFDFRGLFPIKGDNPALKELPDCPELANYIGVSTLLISGDNEKCLYIPRQSHVNQQSPGLLAPSGSGSLDWEDLTGEVAHDEISATCSLRETVIRGMERELREELDSSVDFDLKNAELRTEITGYFRMYERAGKPEFVGISVVHGIDDRSSHRQHGIEVHNIEKFSFSSMTELKNLCEQLLDNQLALSVPLRMSLLFLFMTIEDKEGAGRLNRILWY